MHLEWPGLQKRKQDGVEPGFIYRELYFEGEVLLKMQHLCAGRR